MTRLTTFLIVAALHVAVSAQELELGSLSIISPWSRELPPVAPNGAAYFRVENRGTSADRIISAHSPIAERAELHVHEMNGSMMTMRQVQAVEVPAQGEVRFEPEGLHVMLFGLKRPLVGGERFPLVLVFEAAGELEVPVEIKGVGASGGTDHGSHTH